MRGRIHAKTPVNLEFKDQMCGKALILGNPGKECQKDRMMSSAFTTKQYLAGKCGHTDLWRPNPKSWCGIKTCKPNTGEFWLAE